MPLESVKIDKIELGGAPVRSGKKSNAGGCQATGPGLDVALKIATERSKQAIRSDCP